MQTNSSQPPDLPFVLEPNAIIAAKRAIIYCYVVWSGPELMGRPIIRKAIAELRAASELLAFDFFAIEEDSPVFLEWLESFGWDKYASGAGTVLWIEEGQCIATEINAGFAGVATLVDKTKLYWGSSES